MKRSRVWLELRIGNKSLAENNVRADFAFGNVFPARDV